METQVDGLKEQKGEVDDYECHIQQLKEDNRQQEEMLQFCTVSVWIREEIIATGSLSFPGHKDGLFQLHEDNACLQAKAEVAADDREIKRLWVLV